MGRSRRAGRARRPPRGGGGAFPRRPSTGRWCGWSRALPLCAGEAAERKTKKNAVLLGHRGCEPVLGEYPMGVVEGGVDGVGAVPPCAAAAAASKTNKNAGLLGSGRSKPALGE